MRVPQETTKAWRIGIGALGIIFTFSALNCIAAAVNKDASRRPTRGNEEVYFERASQSVSPICYVARSHSYDVYVSREEADVVLHGGLEQSGEAERGKAIVVHAYADVLRMRFLNAEPPTSVERPMQQGRRSRSAVAYRGVYPGTDVLLLTKQGGIGFQLELSAGADTRNIVVEIGGATSVELDAHGNAIVHAGKDAMVLQRPTVKIQAGLGEQTFAGAYEMEGSNRLRFIVSGDLPEHGQTVADE